MSLRMWGTTTLPSKSGAINSPGPDDPSHDITITDCTFLHGHGLSVGSEIAGGAHNIRAERIHFDGTDNGIRVKANRDRGNDVRHLLFRDIDMKDVKNALSSANIIRRFSVRWGFAHAGNPADAEFP